MKPQVTLADELDAQALALRHMAANWTETAVNPTDLRFQGDAWGDIIDVLHPLDLIDDATALEAAAVKLRTLYD